MVRLYALVFTSLCIVYNASGQSSVPNHVTQGLEWTSFGINAGISKKIGIVNDANFRFIKNFQSQQYQLRTGLEYSITKKFSIVPIGYSYIWNYIYGNQPASFRNNEFRFWQQIQYKHKIGPVAVGYRLRMEERDIQHHHKSESGVTVDDGYSNDQGRLRARVIGTLPLTKTAGASSYYFVSAWDELHYSWGSYVKYRTASQNRLFLGAGYQFSKSTSVQTGFLYQWLKKDSGTMTENNVGVLLQFNYAFAMFKSAR